MLVFDYIIYIFYRLACVDPFWNMCPNLGASFFLSFPISLLLTSPTRHPKIPKWSKSGFSDCC